MLNCLKVLEEAGSKGVLNTRSLETIKKSRGANKPKEGPKNTGVTVPNTVFGQPVAANVGIQMHAGVAVFLKKKDDEYLAKFKIVCPLVACGLRCASVNGFKIHWKAKHDGIAFPGVPAVVAASPDGCDSPNLEPGNAAAASSAAASTQLEPGNAATTASAASKKAKTQHSENEYETCPLCSGKPYLKKNRHVHIASETHLRNAAAAKASDK